jgi:hypothetical protein
MNPDTTIDIKIGPAARSEAGPAMNRKAKRRSSSASYCNQCSKFAWHTRKRAKLEVERLKASHDVKKSYLLDVYRCPVDHGWHVGHNYTLRWLSLSTGEQK